MDTDTGSLQGRQYIIDLAKEIKRTNKDLKVLGCIITKYNARPVISRQFHEVIAKDGQKLKCPLLAEIRQGVAIQEAQSLQLNLFEYAPKSKPAQDYKELYKKIVK